MLNNHLATAESVSTSSEDFGFGEATLSYGNLTGGEHVLYTRNMSGFRPAEQQQRAQVRVDSRPLKLHLLDGAEF
jgi:hypothetical protein